MAEARFLASRESRQEGLQSRKKRHEDLHQFWASLKAYLHKWDQRLDAIVAENTNDQPARSEDDKRRIAVELNGLADDLRQLKRHCVSDDSSVMMFLDSTGSSSSSHGKDDTVRWRSIVPVLDRELPPTDLRLLHDEFSKHHDKLDQVRMNLLPKGKFVFRKYREALKRQQQEETSLLRTPPTTDTTTSTGGPCSTTKSDVADVKVERHEKVARDSTARCSLERLDSVRVVLDAQGRAYRKQDGPSPTCPDQTPAEPPFLQLDVVEGESALILRNIQNSTIELHGSYQSLHLVNVIQSTVVQHVVGGSIQGAIHITHCRHVSCVVHSCQQVRLHESTDLQLKIGIVKGGAILEDCHRIVFVANSIAASKALEVRDFSFLKRGKPSPNYTIEIEPTSSQHETSDRHPAATGTDTTCRPPVTIGPEEQTKLESIDARSGFLTSLSNLEDDEDEDDEEL